MEREREREEFRIEEMKLRHLNAQVFILKNKCNNKIKG